VVRSGPLSLPAGEDGQDHNQLRATHNQHFFFKKDEEKEDEKNLK
jgi:hypothetical protein